MRGFLVGLGCIGAFAGILLLGTATSWFGLVVQRPMAMYAKETDRLVYTQSVAHLQGADSGIGMDCSNMRNVSISLAQRHAFASLVVQDASAYAGNSQLSVESQRCVSEANDLLATAIPTNGT